MQYKLKLFCIICGCLSINFAFPRNKRNLDDVKQYLKSLTQDPLPDFNFTETKNETTRHADLVTTQLPAANTTGGFLRTYRQRKGFVIKLLGGLGVFYAIRALLQSGNNEFG